MKLLTSSSQPKQSKVRTRRQMLATGFASPADSFVENRLDINDLVVQNPTATFFFRVKSTDYKHSIFQPNDILIIDRSQPVKPNGYAVITHKGEFLLTQLIKKGNQIRAINLKTKTEITNDWNLWGMIIHYIRAL